MKKFNFLVKTFCVLFAVVISSHFGDLSAQAYITESQAVNKLSVKLEQLAKTPNASVTFPNGEKVVGDPNNIIRTQYYSMILQKLQEKDASGNPMFTTKSAYESTKAFFNSKPGVSTPSPSTTLVGQNWLHKEALEFLTH